MTPAVETLPIDTHEQLHLCLWSEEYQPYSSLVRCWWESGSFLSLVDFQVLALHVVRRKFRVALSRTVIRLVLLWLLNLCLTIGHELNPGPWRGNRVTLMLYCIDAMLGRRISHSSSIHFSDVDGLRTVKRIKTEESVDTDGASTHDDSDCQSVLSTPRLFRNEIPDSENEGLSDDEEASRLDHRPTELESALPSVQTDKEAIADYEAMRAAETQSSINLTERLNLRSWNKGKSSIYVDAFNLALETVLGDEAHLFDEAETEVFNQWQSLDYETQYMFV